MLRDVGIPVPFRDLPRVGCPHCSSFMHLVGESLSYLSMSHTGPATRLKLPLFLYNSTAALPPLFLSVRIQAVYLMFLWRSRAERRICCCEACRVCTRLCLLLQPVCAVDRFSAGSDSLRSLRRQAAEWLQTGGVPLDTFCGATNQKRGSSGRLRNGGRIERPVLMNR